MCQIRPLRPRSISRAIPVGKDTIVRKAEFMDFRAGHVMPGPNRYHRMQRTAVVQTVSSIVFYVDSDSRCRVLRRHLVISVIHKHDFVVGVVFQSFFQLLDLILTSAPAGHVYKSFSHAFFTPFLS